MVSVDEQASGPSTISRPAFECLVVVMTVVLVVAELAGAWAVCTALGFRIDADPRGGVFFLNWILARVAVDGILRRFGLSRSGKTREVRVATAASPEGETDDDEVVEVRIANATIRLALCGYLLGAALPAALFIGSPRPDAGTTILGIAMIGFFTLGAINIWWDRKPQIWADRDGLTGYPIGLHLRRRFIPWSAVAACEIETVFDTFGKPVIVWPILKGWHGETLITLNLAYTRPEDQERLMKYIRAKLPKPKPDPWEW